ncbi:hypothetical protein HYX13_05770 [Candidatus Woesearchaeota archaeon]|nr:hypothetical protein [Candidatus Woesearchaeota archaeon]
MEINTLILFTFFAIIFLAIGYFIGQKITEHQWKDQLPEIREQAIQRSRSVLAGQFSEQLAPYLPDFPFSPSEARFLGKPTDFLIFRGMDQKQIEEVIFVEVKSGKSGLNTAEKSLKETIMQKKVRWMEYRIPEGVTKKKE